MMEGELRSGASHIYKHSNQATSDDRPDCDGIK